MGSGFDGSVEKFFKAFPNPARSFHYFRKPLCDPTEEKFEVWPSVRVLHALFGRVKLGEYFQLHEIKENYGDVEFLADAVDKFLMPLFKSYCLRKVSKRIFNFPAEAIKTAD